MNLPALSIRQIDALGLTAAALATLLTVVVAFKPVVDHRLERADRQQRLSAERDQVDAMTTAGEGLRRQLDRVEQAIARNSLDLQPPHRLNRRVADLAALADRCDLDLDQVQPGEPDAGDRHYRVSIQLQGEADYADCARFLRTLAEQAADVTVRQMELKAQPGDDRSAADAQPRARFRLDLRWHAAPPTPPATASAGTQEGE